MTKETRLESLLIRFDQDGNIKGAAAYDFEQDRDDVTGEATPLRGELPPRAIVLRDVDGIMSQANLAVAQQNLALQSEKQTLLAQVQAEMTGRKTADDTAKQHREATVRLERRWEEEKASAQSEIALLHAQLDALQNPADPLAGPLSEDERRQVRTMLQGSIA